jgi:hypothetical protein
MNIGETSFTLTSPIYSSVRPHHRQIYMWIIFVTDVTSPMNTWGSADRLWSAYIRKLTDKYMRV